jgi:GntR family transcriptional regulator, transcriptional repressor for pyruvate dehydrogenase complex
MANALSPSITRPMRNGAVAAPRFRAVRSPRAFEAIAAQIRAELAAGRLGVGSRLPSERELAEQFGVSRNTLREALRSLEHAGLVELQKGATGGAFIAQRSGDAIATGLQDLFSIGAVQPAQLTEARIWLEAVVVREACRRVTPQDIAELRRNVDETMAAQTAGDFPLRAEKNIEFHRILARMTGNPIILVLVNGVLDVLRQFIQSIGPYPNRHVVPSRKRFIAHLEVGNADAAVAEMQASLEKLQRVYLSRLGKSIDFGAGSRPR